MSPDIPDEYDIINGLEDDFGSIISDNASKYFYKLFKLYHGFIQKCSIFI